MGDNDSSQLSANKEWYPNIPKRLNIGRVRTIKSFVAGKDFSAILTNTNKFYLWGTVYNPNTGKVSFFYNTPTLISVTNKKYLNLLFTSSATLPPTPSNIESAWRKLKASEIAL